MGVKSIASVLLAGLFLSGSFAAADSPEKAKSVADAPWDAQAASRAAAPPVAAPSSASPGCAVKAGACSKDITHSPDGKPWGPLYFAGYMKMKRHSAGVVVPWLFGKGQEVREEEVYYHPQGVRDSLHARASVLTVRGKTWGLLEVDAVGLSYGDVQKIRDRLKGEGFDLITVAATHNHEGPDTLGFWGPIAVDGFASSLERFLSGHPIVRPRDGKNKRFMDNLIEQSAAALREAKRTSQPASIYLSETPAPKVDGQSIFTDEREPTVFDDLIHIIQTRGADGKAIATLAGVAMHPEVLGSNVTRISADASGAIARNLERRFGGVGIHVNGAIEAISGSLLYGKDDGNRARDAELREKSLEKIGEVVGRQTLQDLLSRLPAPVADMTILTRKIFIPLDNFVFRDLAKTDVFRRPLYTNGVEEPDGQDLLTELNLVILKGPQGEPLAELLTVPGELAPEIYLGGMLTPERAANPGAPDVPIIKNYLKSPHQYLIGLGNDELGYIIPFNDFVYPRSLLGFAQNTKDRLGRVHYHETVSAGTQMASLVSLNLIGMIQDAYDGRSAWTPEAAARKARHDALQTFATETTAVPALVQLYAHLPEDDMTEGARQALLKIAQRSPQGSLDVAQELRRVDLRAQNHEVKQALLRLEREIDAVSNPPAPRREEGKFPSP